MIENHFRQTEKTLREISTDKIADWLLNEGYYPEQYVVPPTFNVRDFKLKEDPYNKNLKDLTRRQLINISFPKSLLTTRSFDIQHPWNYHDMAYWLMKDWDTIINHIFHKDLKVFSYSFPIPIDIKSKGALSSFRSGRMIYEWITMAERDLVAEAHKYRHIVRSDITNFYKSIYTHTIGWALHGRNEALADKDFNFTGNKLDRLIQYANDGRTNGIPIGSAMSDLISEIILASIDRNVSQRLKDIDFLATRFKDDYRFLCNSEDEGKQILKALTEELSNYNLLINENKTIILELPEGLYRQHDREYFKYSLKDLSEINFKTFELTLLKALDIHRLFPGTSLLEKFFSELYSNDYRLMITFSNDKNARRKQILKTFSLLILVKRESEKVLCHVLAIMELIFQNYREEFDMKKSLHEIISSEIIKASERKSVFELTWLVFFSRYLNLGIEEDFLIKNIPSEIRENAFLSTIIDNHQRLFPESSIKLYRTPKKCRDIKLSKRLAVFKRSDD